MEIVIRIARTEDIPGMCDLLTLLFTLESDFSPDVTKQVKGLSMLISDPAERSLVIVASMGKNIIGMGTVQLVVSTAEGGMAGLVEDVVVHEDYRRMGIGLRVLSRLIEWSKQKGATRVQLLADAYNGRALDFYSGSGWTRTSLICLRKFI